MSITLHRITWALLGVIAAVLAVASLPGVGV
jgi:hypothetical protein